MSTPRSSFTSTHRLLLLGLTILAFILRLYRLDVQSFWYDEAFSTFVASQPWAASVQTMLTEGLHNSPFFHLLLRPFAAGGFNEFSLRFLSVTIGVLAVPLMAQTGRILAGTRVGLLAATLLVFSPFHLWYSQETRMYVLNIGSALGAMLFFVRSLSRPRLSNWAGLALFMAIGFNTHYFTFYVPLIQFVFLLITLKRNYLFLRPWFGSVVGAGILFVPWLLVMLDWGNFYFSSVARQAANGYDLVQTLWNFSIGYTAQLTPFVVIVVSLFAGLFVLGINATYRTDNGLLLLLWALLPPLVTFLMSFRLPLYVDRYISLSLPAFLLLVAIGIGCLRLRTVRLVMTGLVLATMLGGVSRVYYDTNVYNRADWRSLGAYLEKNAGAGDTIALWEHQTLLSLYFYYHGVAPLEPVMILDQVNLPQLPATPTPQKLWMVIDYPNTTTHMIGHCQAFDLKKLGISPKFKEWLDKNQNRVVGVKEFPCIRLQIYE